MANDVHGCFVPFDPAFVPEPALYVPDEPFVDVGAGAGIVLARKEEGTSHEKGRTREGLDLEEEEDSESGMTQCDTKRTIQ